MARTVELARTPPLLSRNVPVTLALVPCAESEGTVSARRRNLGMRPKEKVIEAPERIGRRLGAGNTAWSVGTDYHSRAGSGNAVAFGSSFGRFNVSGVRRRRFRWTRSRRMR